MPVRLLLDQFTRPPKRGKLVVGITGSRSCGRSDQVRRSRNTKAGWSRLRGVRRQFDLEVWMDLRAASRHRLQ